MIFVFKTSVNTEVEAKKLGQHLDKIQPHLKWNFDLEDRDKILRVDGSEDIVFTIIDLLKFHNYNCEEVD